MGVNDSDLRWLVIVVALVALGAAAWYFRDLFVSEPPAVAGPGVETPGDEVRLGPIHPLEPAEAAGEDGRTLVPLPPLDDSDGYFSLALTDIFGPGLARLLVSEALIDKVVASIDNLPRSHVSEKVRPVGQLGGSFIATIPDDDDQVFLSGENHARYDELVNTITAADPEVVVGTYRRFYPLFQEAYVRLGYPDGYFNDRLVEVIDHLLETPEVDEPLALTRPNVLYEFADPDLESLSSGQKLLLRMGPDNAARIKKMLAEVRALIA